MHIVTRSERRALTSVKSLYLELAAAILEASPELTGSPQFLRVSSEQVSSFSLLAMLQSWAQPASDAWRCSFEPPSTTGQPFLFTDDTRFFALAGLGTL